MLTAPPHNLEGHPVATLAIPPVQRLTDQGTGRWTGAEPAFPVLIVDDQPVWLDWVTLHLGEIWTPAQGLTIDCAEDGAVALAKLLTNQFALVILDWNLPVLGKGEVLRQLRRRGIHTPVVILSSVTRAEIDDDLEAFDAAYVSKAELCPATLELAIAHACGCVMLDDPPLSGKNRPLTSRASAT